MTARQLRQTIHEIVLADAKAAATTDQKICLSSASAPHNGYWLSVPFGVPPTVRYLNQLFPVLCRLRAGQPQGDASYTCPSCNKPQVGDAHRHHVLSCMEGGSRTSLHNRYRRTLTSLMSVSLLEPREETRCFTDTSLRADITYTLASSVKDKQFAIDLAFTSPFLEGHRTVAVATPGGAATVYEGVKRAKYLPHTTPDQVFVPLVGDMLGAWGSSALPFLKDIATVYAKRYPHHVAAKIHFYSTLNNQFMRQIATLILRSSAPLEA